MISDNTRQILPKLRASLAKQPVSVAWLFGSCSRGEERADSDVDLLVRYIDSDSTRPKSKTLYTLHQRL